MPSIFPVQQRTSPQGQLSVTSTQEAPDQTLSASVQAGVDRLQAYDDTQAQLSAMANYATIHASANARLEQPITDENTGNNYVAIQKAAYEKDFSTAMEASQDNKTAQVALQKHYFQNLPSLVNQWTSTQTKWKGENSAIKFNNFGDMLVSDTGLYPENFHKNVEDLHSTALALGLPVNVTEKTTHELTNKMAYAASWKMLHDTPTGPQIVAKTISPVSNVPAGAAFPQIMAEIDGIEKGYNPSDGKSRAPVNGGINAKFNNPKAWAKDFGAGSETYNTLMQAAGDAITPEGGIDVRKLTTQGIRTIYKTAYWDQIGGEKLPPPVAAIAMNVAVNGGVGAARKLIAASGGSLQKAKDLQDAFYDRAEETYGDGFYSSRKARINTLADRMQGYAPALENAGKGGAPGGVSVENLPLTAYLKTDQLKNLYAEHLKIDKENKSRAAEDRKRSSVAYVAQNADDPNATKAVTDANLQRFITGEEDSTAFTGVNSIVGSLSKEKRAEEKDAATQLKEAQNDYFDRRMLSVHERKTGSADIANLYTDTDGNKLRPEQLDRLRTEILKVSGKSVLDDLYFRAAGNNLTHRELEELQQRGEQNGGINGKDYYTLHNVVDKNIKELQKDEHTKYIDQFAKDIDLKNKTKKDVTQEWFGNKMTTEEHDKLLKRAETSYKLDDANSFIESVKNNPTRIGTAPHVQAMNTLWGSGKEEGKEGTLSYQFATAEDKGAFLAAMAERLNGLPGGAKTSVDTILAVGSAKQKANIVQGLISLKRNNPYAANILGELPQKTQDILGLTQSAVDSGIPPEDAINTATQTVNPTEPITKQREKELNTLNMTTNKMRPFDKYEQDNWKPWFAGNTVADGALSANNRTQRDALAADYDNLFALNFTRHGNDALAAEQAHKSIAMRYAPSVANHGYLMKDAPEAIYQVRGDDVRDYMTKAGIKPDEQLFPIRDNNNNLTYIVRDKEGNPLFDPKTGGVTVLRFDKEKLQEPVRALMRQYGTPNVSDKRFNTTYFNVRG